MPHPDRKDRPCDLTFTRRIQFIGTQEPSPQRSKHTVVPGTTPGSNRETSHPSPIKLFHNVYIRCISRPTSVGVAYVTLIEPVAPGVGKVGRWPTQGGRVSCFSVVALFSRSRPTRTPASLVCSSTAQSCLHRLFRRWSKRGECPCVCVVRDPDLGGPDIQRI